LYALNVVKTAGLRTLRAMAPQIALNDSR